MAGYDEHDVYLGDGLFAAFDGWQVELYAWNGVNKTNCVFLEPAVLEALLNYVKRLKAQYQAKPGEDLS